MCTVIGYIISADHTVKPWKLDTALTCMQFMTFGYLIHNIRGAEDKCVKPLSIAVYGIILVGFNFIWRGCRVNVNIGDYFNPIAFSVLAYVGVAAVFAIAKLISNVKPLLFIGKNTFVYFVFHVYMMQLVFALIMLIPNIGILPMWILCAVITVISCVFTGLVCLVINKYFWFTVGIKKKI